MRCLSMIVLAICLVGGNAMATEKGEFGTADEARAMLARAVEALKADKAKALAMFNAKDGSFRDRDLYVACAGPEGKMTSHPDATLIGKDRRQMNDASGKAFGAEIESVAKEGEVAEVSYVYPRPGADKTPVAKVGFVTRTGDQVCVVGYYK